MSKVLSYRPDIDTLRAVAVLSVVVFHIEKNWLPGGFLGVDIFFVISGFLITMIIHREMSSGIFSFKKFYIRRIKRILPAFFTVLTVTLYVAFFYSPKMISSFYGGQLCPPWDSSPISFLQRVRAISTPYKKKNLYFTFGLYRLKNSIISSSRYCCYWLSAKAGALSLPSSSRYAYSAFWLLLCRLHWINITFPTCAPAKC